jgi:hypothetical protein
MAFGDEVIMCSELNRPHDRITFKVIECSRYDDKSRPSLGSMQSIAWQLCTDKAGRQIGFLSPRDKARRTDIDELPYLKEPELVRRY